MKTATAIGLILILAGALALAYQGITYTKKEEVVEMGPVEISAESKETIPIPPVLGGLTILAGVVMVFASERRK